MAEEVAELLKAVQEALALARPDDFFKTWDTLASLRERFRERTRLGVSGEEKNVTREEIDSFLRRVDLALAAGLSKAFTRDGLCVTYYVNEVAEYEKLPMPARAEETDAAPPQYVRALRFKQIPLALFWKVPCTPCARCPTLNRPNECIRRSKSRSSTTAS